MATEFTDDQKAMLKTFMADPEWVEKLTKAVEAEDTKVEGKTSSTPGFYGVAIGKKPGVYASLEEAREQVKGVRPSLYLKFDTRREAQQFVDTKTCPEKGDGGGEKNECSRSSCLRTCSLYS